MAAAESDSKTDSKHLLWEASKAGNLEVLQKQIALCIEQQVSINAGNPKRAGCTALHYAAWNGMSASVAALAEAKADVNVSDSCGRTPLHFASRKGHTVTVHSLVHLSADVNARQEMGGTALHYAALEGHTATCQKLLRLGADLSSANNTGSTALSLAESRDHTKTVLYLKQAAEKRERKLIRAAADCSGALLATSAPGGPGVPLPFMR